MARRSIQAFFAAILVGGLLLIGSAAGAVDDPDYTSPPPTTSPVPTTTVLNREVRRVPTAVVPTTPIRSRLAITGSDVGQLAVLGSVLVLTGGVVLVLRNRRTTAA